MILFCDSTWHRSWYSAHCNCALKSMVTEDEVDAVMTVESRRAEDDDLWRCWVRLGSPILVRWGNGVSWGGAGSEVKVTCSSYDWHQKRRSHLVLRRTSSPSAGLGRSGVLWPGVPVCWHAAPLCYALLAEGGSDPPEDLRNENKCTKCHAVKKKKKKTNREISVICPMFHLQLLLGLGRAVNIF